MRRRIIFMLLAVIFTLCACGAPATDSLATASANATATPAPIEAEAVKKEPEQTAVETVTPETNITYPMTLTDMMSREVVILSEPQRIVSLTPSNTEILFALGLGEKIVGVDSYSDYPEAALGIEKIGDYSGVNVEMALALQPDLVLAGDKLQHETIERLTDLGLTVMACEAARFSQIPDSITLIAQATGSVDAAKNLIASFNDKREVVEQRVKALEAPKVYYAVSFGDWGDYTAGKGSYINDVITLAGGINVARDMPVPWPSYSLEQLIIDDPDFIIIGGDQAMADEFAAGDVYKSLRAVQEGKVFAMDANMISRPALRVIESLEELAGILHPQ